MMQTGRSRTSCSPFLRGFLNIDHSNTAASHLPLYLCPVAARRCASTPTPPRRLLPLRQTRQLHLENTTPHDDPTSQAKPLRDLPVQCPGCGALSQTAVPGEPGYFGLKRRAVKAYIGTEQEESRHSATDAAVLDALKKLSSEQLADIGLDLEDFAPRRPSSKPTNPEQSGSDVPLCDRCHTLIHHHTGTPIYHPTIESIKETIDESPYKYNHVYHVMDAADFPMSLLPGINSLLDLMPMRSQNRRSRKGRFFAGKKTEMSFIITRSDLLAPRKDQVDRLMPYLVECLRDALGRVQRNVRLGNVKCVSAKRSWWTKELKEDIWQRGGAGWMVGKVNVGKSQLFESVFPKGRMDTTPSKHQISIPVYAHGRVGEEHPGSVKVREESPLDELDEDSLLPPAQEETNYPRMPVVSSLPGTTASPIRVPFGGGKGELIDLPGLARSGLENFVLEEYRPSLVMKSRISPEQQVIKPGRSLLLGGFIRITPRTPNLIFLAYAFTPITPHLSATEKAVSIQEQRGEVNVENIAVPGTGEKIKHAGSFDLQYDVTKRRVGPITRKDAVGMKVDRLPYRVLAIDILIEGCGWVEIVAQVRLKDLELPRPPPSIRVSGEEILQTLDLSEDADRRNGPNWPVIDVYSPEGRFIGSRAPMNAWLLNKALQTAATTRKRPRKSMAGAKKREKTGRRD